MGDDGSKPDIVTETEREEDRLASEGDRGDGSKKKETKSNSE